MPPVHRASLGRLLSGLSRCCFFHAMENFFAIFPRSYEKASQEVRFDGHRFAQFFAISLLFALVVELLLLRCMVGSVAGRCYLWIGLFHGVLAHPQSQRVNAVARTERQRTVKRGCLSLVSLVLTNGPQREVFPLPFSKLLSFFGPAGSSDYIHHQSSRGNAIALRACGPRPPRPDVWRSFHPARPT